MLGKVKVCSLVYVLCLRILWQELQSHVDKTLLWKSLYFWSLISLCYCGLCSEIPPTRLPVGKVDDQFARHPGGMLASGHKDINTLLI